MGDHPPSELVRKGQPCPACGSSDALAEYDDGHTHCFSCKVTKWADGPGRPAESTSERVPSQDAITEAIGSGKPQAIPSRKLTLESCRKWDYLVRETRGKHRQHLAVYRNAKGHPVGVKVRDTGTVQAPGKSFVWIGDGLATLYGRNLWGSGGKKLVITEGEVDAITVSQAQSHQWPVVSIPGGVDSAVKAITANLEWVNSFEQVLIGFDMDQQGRDACNEVANLLPPGKAFIVKWTEKDPNAMLLAGDGERITKCLWEAEAFRPDGIRDARSLTAECLAPNVLGLPWPWKPMTRWTYGRRHEETYVFGAGTGLGKTDALAEIIAADLQGKTKYGVDYPPQSWACFVYEGGPANFKNAVAGKLVGKQFTIPEDDEDCNYTHEDKVQAHTLMDGPLWQAGGRFFINDHRGAPDWDVVRDRCRFLHHAEGIEHFLIDPISALVIDEDDERKLLDAIAIQATQMAVELQSCVYLTSHLTRPKDGPPHEEGGRVKLGQLRGANGIGMFTSYVFGLERNQQADTEDERLTTTFRVVKDRRTGRSTGKTEPFRYDPETGRLDTKIPEDFEG